MFQWTNALVSYFSGHVSVVCFSGYVHVHRDVSLDPSSNVTVSEGPEAQSNVSEGLEAKSNVSERTQVLVPCFSLTSTCVGLCLGAKNLSSVSGMQLSKLVG